MGVIFKKNKLTSFASETSLRFDYLFNDFVSQLSGDYYIYKELFDIVEYSKLDISELSIFKYAEIGNVEKTGDVNPITLSFDDRNELNESLFKKIEKGDIIKPKKDDILISKIRPYLNKNVLIGDEDIYYTKAFIQIKPKINSTIFYHSLRSIFFKNLNAVSRQGKGYPTLKEDDLKTIRFPKNVIDAIINNQDLLIKKITPIEQEIKTLKESKKDVLGIINEVFGEEFNIELEKIEEIDKKKTFSISLSDTYKRNSNLRNSLRWNKIQEIQKKLYSNISCINKLGNYIIETKNGWSPSSQEGGEGTLILGQEHFNYSGKLKISPSKATEETKRNINDFYIKNGDFFVSRGNTVDLVALASIVQEKIKENIIFPDLYIKITFKEKYINKEYIALLFNSFLGRYYFKYVSKGKNQTMVKISSKELNDFYLPVPTKEKQTEIVEKIKSRIDAQKNIDTQIEKKQNQISKIIEDAIHIANKT
jgi:type I restriction enzyme S subunit